MKLPTQVFVSHTKPEPHLLEPTLNGEEFFWKPRGGLWTSTLDEEGGDWVRWLCGENYSLADERWGGQLWLLQPADVNVYVVRTPDDLKALHARFPLPMPEKLSSLRSFRHMVDWEAVAHVYDAVHIPNPWPYRFGMDETSMFFYILDAECTCWFRWCFEGEPLPHELTHV